MTEISRLADVVGQPEAVELLERIVASLSDCGKPNGALFFVGPTGVGKTSTARSLSAEIPGAMVNEFNCGRVPVRVIGDRLDEMVESTVTRWDDRWESSKLIVLLDEIDRLTKNDRIALRRPIELLANRALIVMTANRELGDAGLASRSLRVEFARLDDEAARILISRDAAALGTQLDEPAVQWVVDRAKGDGRKIGQLVPIAPNDISVVPMPVATITNRLGGRPRAEFDVDLAIRLRAAGKSWSDVAEAVGSRPSTVRGRLTKTPCENPAQTPSGGVSANGFRKEEGAA